MNRFFFILFLFLILLVSNVFAQNVVEDVLSAIAGDDFDITRIYDKYGAFIDIVVYLIVFVGVANATLMKRFKGAGGKAITIGVGIVLAVSLAYWGRSTDPPFTIASFGPFAGFVLALLIFVAIYEIMKGFLRTSTLGGKGKAAIIAFVIVWYGMQTVAPGVTKWVGEIPTIGPVLKAIVSIGLILTIYYIIAHFSKTGLFGKTSPMIKKTEAEIGVVEGKEKKEKRFDLGELIEEKKILSQLKNLNHAFKKIKSRNNREEWIKIKEDINTINKDLKKLSIMTKEEYLLKRNDLNKKQHGLLTKEGASLQLIYDEWNKLIKGLYSNLDSKMPLSPQISVLIKNVEDMEKLIRRVIRIEKREIRAE